MEGLAPCVQDGDDADFGAEVLAIGGNGGKGLGRSLEQQSIDLGLILVGHRTDCGRKLEYEMKVRHRLKARLRAPQAMLPRPAIGIYCSAYCGTSYRRCVCAHSPRSALHDHRARQCDKSRSPSSHVVGQGSRGRHWPYATPHHGGGRYPPPRASAGTCRARVSSEAPAQCSEFEWALNFSDHVDGSPHSREVAHGGLHRQAPRHLNGIDQYGYCKRLGDRPG